ncbi:hypothetical protein JRO89_XS03G0336100 [Xanthoceras sorbifolium]|uniref:Subtilisin-like protease SBT5.3 n=1 Tax=Xanthoceras sorbifolium TaxID=99658 RepID=A0ABQ8IDE7_9ROSI|nr:hypothetical protein JRO89_XS03G0336100 [Xanthoceras sorbifolium]
MRISILSSVLLCISVFSLIHTPAFAIKKSYIVYLGSHSHGSDPTSADQKRATDSHHEFLGSFLRCKEKAKQSIFYSYNKHINGFAATLEEKEAEEIAKHPQVISIFENKIRQLHTTRSWDFLGLEKGSDVPLNSLWKKASFGDGIIIGNIDTGIWPESESFSDEGMGPVPSRWRGICQSGMTEEGLHDGIKCNRKLIGIRYFSKGAEEKIRSSNMTLPSMYSLLTARDFNGHGTHTLSTAGGNFVANVSVLGYGNGTAKGGSPQARVAAYKACWQEAPNGCTDADIIAAIEAAISDGVDVISSSLGDQQVEYFDNGAAIGAIHAMMRGIPVVASAGNDGPTPSSILNTAPWILTVGASTIDREFVSYVTLGNGKLLQGASLSSIGLPPQTFYPLIMGADVRMPDASPEDANHCSNFKLIDREKLEGKLLVCIVKQENPTTQTSSLQEADDTDMPQVRYGIIMVSDEEIGNDVRAELMSLPISHINFTDGESLFAYINSTKNPVAHITNAKTEFNTKPAPMVARFSSRGPCKLEPNIIKPDITAPGVNIIAANLGDPNFPYKTNSGTSMSCPHVAGIVGLLKTLHPDWTPSAIKSAIMTTATTEDTSSCPIVDLNNKEATPFDYGSGHVRPDLAADPGLVYDLTVGDYLNFLCTRGYNETAISLFYSGQPFVCPKTFSLADFNYPSIAVANLSDSVTITRRLKNVGEPGTYKVSVQELAGVLVQVEPESLTFGKQGEEHTFKVVLKRNDNVQLGRYVFGGLTWSDGSHHVRSPIAVKL